MFLCTPNYYNDKLIDADERHQQLVLSIYIYLRQQVCIWKDA